MARRRTTIAYIAKDADRRATFKKRRGGLLKKIYELATLCDVMACAVIYEPETHQVEVWPSKQEARCVLQRLKDMPQVGQSKSMLNQEGYLRERIEKQQRKLRSITNENHQLEMAVLMHDGLAGRSLHGLGMDKMWSLGQFLDDKVRMIQMRLNAMKDAVAAAATAAASTREKAVMIEDQPALQQNDWGSIVPNYTTATATVMIEDQPALQQNDWGSIVPNYTTATATNRQMFFGSGSSSSSRTGGQEELVQPYPNIGSSRMHFSF